jgi:hypothetical protein
LIKITDPDGTPHNEKASVLASEARFGTGRCDVQIGPHRFQGDLQEYDIHVHQLNGVGAELHLSSRESRSVLGPRTSGSVTGTRTTSPGCAPSQRAT